MEFQRNDLVALLNKLTTRLNQLDIQGTFRIVGGAAISLQHADREPTLDIDADFISSNDTKNEIKQVIEEIANSEGLSPNWLNDFAMVFLPKQTNDDWIQFQQFGAIEILRIFSRYWNFAASPPLRMQLPSTLAITGMKLSKRKQSR